MSSHALPVVPSINELDSWLIESESAAGNVLDGTEKTIIWSNNSVVVKAQTPLSVVYIHGFSASRQETAPVSDQVAETLNANLFYTRLAGHGLAGEGLGDASKQNWLSDTLEAIAVGERIGKKAVVIGVSTGASLLSYLAAERLLPASVTAMVFISPNFGPVDRRTEIFNRRFGLRIAKKLVGPTYRWEPRNEDHEKYWTCEFPLEALAEMMKCVVESRASIEQRNIDIPVLTLYCRDDKTVAATKTEEMIKYFVSEKSRVIEIDTVEDLNNHVLAGDIMAPSNTAMVRDYILDYVGSLNRRR